MATDTSQFTTATGGVDYDAMRRSLMENVRRVTNVVGGGGLRQVEQAAGRAQMEGRQAGARTYNPVYNRMQPQFSPEQQAAMKNRADTGQAVASDAAAQLVAMRQQAKATGEALRWAGAARIQEMQGYDRILSNISASRTNMADYWQAADQAADEAVRGANERMGQIMDKMDKAIADIGDNWETATTHALQVQVAGGLSSMRAEEKAIRQQYGEDSPEMQQFNQQKMVSMHIGISNLHSQTAQMRAQIDSSLALGRAQVGGQMSTLVNYAEKDRTAERIARAEAAMYDLQASELEMQAEAMRANGMEQFASLFTQVGAFQFEALPWINVLNQGREMQVASYSELQNTNYPMMENPQRIA